MENFFRQYPLAIACALGGIVIGSWLFDSWILIILSLIAGAAVGGGLDSKKRK